MAKWWIVNTETRELIDSGDDNFKTSCSLGKDQQWLEVPVDVAPGNCAVEESEGELYLVESEDKVGPKWKALRAERNSRLAACDWTDLPHAPLDGAQHSAWEAYRDALRDLPESTEDPEIITWPVQP